VVGYSTASLGFMSEASATMSGQLFKWPEKEALAATLASAGLNVQVGRYSVRVKDCEHFSFEQYGNDTSSPEISADAETTERMIQDTKIVSAALAQANIRHRFEVYDENDQLVAYVHHDWPRE
jgi:hypothetical protein